MALHTFYIPEASVSLFPINSAGEAITTDPLWNGLTIRGLRLSEKLTEVIDHPTGVDYGEAHHTDEEHEIGITKLWELELPLADKPSNLAVTLARDLARGDVADDINARQYRPKRNQQYIMVIIWEDQRDDKRFYYRCYYGVTDRTKELQGRGDEGVEEQLTFRAKYYLE